MPAFPAAPMAAPLPKGTTLPSTRMPCLVPYLLTVLAPRILLIRRMPLIGMAPTSLRPKCGPARPAMFSTTAIPSGPARS